MPQPQIEFDKKYKDRITGFTGTCTGIVHYISGCDQALLLPTVGEDGKFVSGQWFDDERLIDVESGERVARISRKGGPQSDGMPHS